MGLHKPPISELNREQQREDADPSRNRESDDYVGEHKTREHHEQCNKTRESIPDHRGRPCVGVSSSAVGAEQGFRSILGTTAVQARKVKSVWL